MFEDEQHNVWLNIVVVSSSEFTLNILDWFHVDLLLQRLIHKIYSFSKKYYNQLPQNPCRDKNATKRNVRRIIINQNSEELMSET